MEKDSAPAQPGLFGFSDRRWGTVSVADRGWITGLVPLSSAALVMVLLAVQPWGWRVGISLGVCGLLCLFYGVYSVYQSAKREARQHEAEKMLELIGQKRHDWMNHVQVILAYDAMKRRERIRPYLNRLARQALVERQMSEVNNPSLALALIQLSSHYPEWQWKVEIQSDFHLPLQSDGERMTALLQMVTRLLSSVSVIGGEPNMEIHLAMEEDRPILLMFSGEKAWREYLSNWDGQDQLQEEVQKWGGKARLLDKGEGIAITLLKERRWWQTFLFRKKVQNTSLHS